MSPQISVIMSTFNNASTIRDAVVSILSQSFEDFEFLVVNDGSTDGTVEILAGFTDPRLRLVQNASNIGLTRSLNKAIALSSGRYIARQDADDISLPERLEKQFRFLEEHSDISLLGTSRATLDDSGRVVATTVLPESPDVTRLLKSNCLAHGSIMLRREVLEDVGLYNEDFRLSQDYEFWLRIAKQHKIMNLQEPLYGVRRHNNRVTLSKLPQAGLFRLLAVNLARGEVSSEVMEKIRNEGVEAYYAHLSPDDRLKFHKAASLKYAKYRRYGEAEQHLEKLVELDPRSFGARLRLGYVRLRKWQRGS